MKNMCVDGSSCCASLYLTWVDKKALSWREKRVLKRLKNKISRIDGVESIWEWMVKSFEVKIGPLFSFSFSLKGASAPSGANVRVIDRFIDAVLEVGQSKKFSVLIDGVDPIWDRRTEESKLMIIGLLQTVREFNACAAQKRSVGGPASAICFLRTDIFNGIEYSDRNKIQGGAIRLQWQASQLIDVVVRRARFLLGDESIGWNDFVTSEKMRNRLDAQGYLYRRTMERPRDLLAFVGAAARLAANRNHLQIEVEDIYDSEVEYARHIYDEMGDETSGNREEFMCIVQGLKKIGVNKFQSLEWISLPLWETQLDGEKVLQNALARSIVGIERVGGSQPGGHRGGTRVEYTYAGKGVTLPAGGATVVVHPTFVKVLSLKESRKSKKSQ